MQNKFEDIIKQQVKDFELTPNAAVWEGIEAKIGQKKKRRGAFWLWSGLVGISLLGIVYFELNTKKAIVPNQANETKLVNGDLVNQLHNSNPSTKYIKEIKSYKERKTLIDEEVVSLVGTINKKDASRKVKNVNTNYIVDNVNTRKNEKQKAEQAIPYLSENKNKNENKNESESIINGLKNDTASAFLIDTINSFNAISKSDSVSKKDTQQLISLTNSTKEEMVFAKDSIKNDKKKMKVLLELGVGALYTKARLSANENSLMEFNNTTTSGSIASNNVENRLVTHSKIGFAINGGIVLQKQLSNKWQLLSGINYVYYQDKQTVGNRNASTNSTDDGYVYLLGNKETKSNYTNSLQVPIRFNYLIGRYLKQDFHVAIGGNIGYQLKSNWLVNENNSNFLYYKKSLNKNLFGSFTIGINTTLKNNVMVSLEAEQAITKLQKNDKINGKYKALYFKVGIPLR